LRPTIKSATFSSALSFDAVEQWGCKSGGNASERGQTVIHQIQVNEADANANAVLDFLWPMDGLNIYETQRSFASPIFH
jgi:hypothetical protein